jgi:hypothetical protein
MDENPYKAPVDGSPDPPKAPATESAARKVLGLAIAIPAAIVGWVVTGYIVQAIKSLFQ